MWYCGQDLVVDVEHFAGLTAVEDMKSQGVFVEPMAGVHFVSPMSYRHSYAICSADGR